MSIQQTKKVNEKEFPTIGSKQGRIWMTIAIGLLILGNILLWKKPGPDLTNDPAIFTPVHTIVAPIVLIAGYIIIIFAIMRRK